MVKMPDEVQVEAARFLQTALPTFRSNLEKLASDVMSDEAKLFVKSLIQYPFDGDMYTSDNKPLEELFKLHLDIFNAKSLILAGEYLKMELEHNKEHLEQAVKQIVQEKTKEATTNG